MKIKSFKDIPAGTEFYTTVKYFGYKNWDGYVYEEDGKVFLCEFANDFTEDNKVHDVTNVAVDLDIQEVVLYHSVKYIRAEAERKGYSFHLLDETYVGLKTTSQGFRIYLYTCPFGNFQLKYPDLESELIVSSKTMKFRTDELLSHETEFIEKISKLFNKEDSDGYTDIWTSPYPEGTH